MRIRTAVTACLLFIMFGLVANVSNAHATAMPSARPCAKQTRAVPAKHVPRAVKAWASGSAVIGRGSLWALHQALRLGAVKLPDGTRLMKFPWYVIPPGSTPTITGHRLDGRGTFRADTNVATGADPGRVTTFVTSSLHFSSLGCWEVTGRYRRSVLTFRIQVHPSAIPGSP